MTEHDINVRKYARRVFESTHFGGPPYPERYIVEGKATAAEDASRRILQHIGSAAHWDDTTGVLYVDYTAQRNAAILKATGEAQNKVEQYVQQCLTMEERIWKLRKGESVSFPDVITYIDFMTNKFIANRNYGPTERGPYEPKQLQDSVKSSLVEFWKAIARDVRAKQAAIDDEGYLCYVNYAGEQSRLRGCYSSFWGKLQDGMSFDFGYEAAYSSNEATWLTHTTHSDYVPEILKSGHLDSQIVRFSRSQVFSYDASPFDELTFFFDPADILASVPVETPDYASTMEREVVTHFPLPLAMARAVVPTAFLHYHHETPLHPPTSSSYFMKELEEQLIVKQR